MTTQAYIQQRQGGLAPEAVKLRDRTFAPEGSPDNGGKNGKTGENDS